MVEGNDWQPGFSLESLKELLKNTIYIRTSAGGTLSLESINSTLGDSNIQLVSRIIGKMDVNGLWTQMSKI